MDHLLYISYFKNSGHPLSKVKSRDDILCRNLETDRESWFDERDLETVIPRSNDQVVMIISGKSRGSYGIMVDKIKGKIF